MSERRHTHKHKLDPSAVHSLPSSNLAMRENRTLFPSTVVKVTKTTPDRLLVSGVNNIKLGATVEKGKFKGYALYQLSLEERATCPLDCEVRNFCYGNGMQFARRHRIGDADVFYDRLGFEICEILDDNIGLLVRLHVLGDFPSVEYVSFWKEALDEYPKLAVFGYTHRRPGNGGDEIGDAIRSVKLAHPDRFRIRWSAKSPAPDSAVVIDYVPSKPRVVGGQVCPAQTDATACCATCGFCWEAASKRDAVMFIKHGPKDKAFLSNRDYEGAAPDRDVRPIAPIPMMPRPTPDEDIGAPPTMRLVNPTELLVEASYQRDLNPKSRKLIRNIVNEWSWTKFKPPICADTKDGLFVIDGQHTAIAAAMHPSVSRMPVMIVPADRVSMRAAAFVAHNRDRLAMSALQIFHAEVAGEDSVAVAIQKIATEVGVTFPRYVPPKGFAKPGQCVAATALRRVYERHGAKTLRRVLHIASLSKYTPIASTLVYGLDLLCCDPRFTKTAAKPDAELAKAISSITNIERAAQDHTVEIGQNRYTACADLIARSVHTASRRVAA